MDATIVSLVENYLNDFDDDSQQEMLGPETLQREMNLAEKKLRSAKGVKQLLLLQRREDLTALMYGAQQLAPLEEEVVSALAEYAELNELSHTSLREFGISKQLLERAGMRRTRRKVKVPRT